MSAVCGQTVAGGHQPDIRVEANGGSIHHELIVIDRQARLYGPGDLDFRLINPVVDHKGHIDKRRIHRRQRLGCIDETLGVKIHAILSAGKAGPGRDEAT